MKQKRITSLFFTTSIIIFILLFVITVSYSYAVSSESWYLDVFTARFFYIPFIWYLLAASVAIGLTVSTIIYYINKRQWHQIEETLHLLIEANYSKGIFEEMLIKNKEDYYFTDELNQSLVDIREKLVTLANEVQLNNNTPNSINGQTKEEILVSERHRLARELHDSVSQQLFAAMMMLSALNEQMDESKGALQKQVRLIESIVNEAQSEMRALLLHLRPVNLEGKSLKKGIEQLLNELRTKIQIEMKWDIEDVCLTNGIEDHLFRIVQELLSNTLRHSKAKELEVYLHVIDQSVLLRVIDDGIGFNTEESKAGNYGLQNIKERVLGMGGTCKIISFKNKGTSIEIKIPLMNKIEKVEVYND
ncbi:sensor histidine kinase [Carnobacterium sp. FSL W8-0810]|uniref:sensor histidine kinase n=1 Tax=Carnobacterium sp. FSL W8-0810 TaxID=2954705 RepID=UPI0030FB1A4B